MHRLPLIIGAVLVGAIAVVPPSAAAKQLQTATLCGPDACARVPREELSIALIEGGTTSSAPRRAEPWYRMRAKIGGGGAHARLSLVVLPRGGYVGGFAEATGASYDWTTIGPQRASLYRHLVGGLRPFPAATLDLPPKPRALGATPGGSPAEATVEGDGGPLALAGVLGGAVLLVGGVVFWRRRSANGGDRQP